MSNSNDKLYGAGNEVMKAIGALTDVVNKTESSKEDDETTPEEVGNWITVIGKALLSILK